MNSKIRIQQCNVDSPKARACSSHTFSLIISRLGKTNITRLYLLWHSQPNRLTWSYQFLFLPFLLSG